MILFEAVFTPESHRLGAEGQGLAMALQALDGGRLNIAACSVGTARSALREAIAYVKTRRQFGQPISQFQAVQFRLADMATELHAARALLQQAAQRYDIGHRSSRSFCAMAKRFCTDVGYAVADAAVELHGGYGVLGDYPAERHLRDLRLHRLLEGTNDIMRLITARQLLDEDTLEGML
jgi:alkylation response protein AidB-like acyl-CoA dehydrogenase